MTTDLCAPETLGPSNKGYGHCSLSCKPQGQTLQDKTSPQLVPALEMLLFRKLY